MKLSDRIQYQKIKPTWAVTMGIELTDRNQLPSLFQELKGTIPQEFIAGPPFCILQFVSSVSEGYEAEVVYPVQEAFGKASEQARLLPALEVLSLAHQGPLEELGGSYQTLYGWAAERGIISDEFCREIYPDPDTALPGEVVIQFVIHAWDELFEEHKRRVLGDELARSLSPKTSNLQPGSSLEERFQWVCEGVSELETVADGLDSYQVLSNCAHVFPAGQIAKLREVFQSAEKQTGDRLAAVDAVIDFMGQDPGWGERPRREGYTIYSSKGPRDPAAYEKALSPEEKKKAYCFCPLIRNNLDRGMPSTFCYCGGGWYRQQWEGAVGEPVVVDIVRSLLKGDELCEFAIHLPRDISPGDH